MDKNQKAEVVAELREELTSAASIVLANYQGLSVEDINTMRRELHESNTQFRVVKNTLAKHSIKETEITVIGDLLIGPTALIFNLEDPVTPAKVLLKYVKEFKKFEIKGGYLDGQLLDYKGVIALSKLKGKDELRSMLLQVLNGVATQMVRVLSGGQSQMLNLLTARKDALSDEEAA